jgi:ornithine cyclodeaminase/alanine dehydrogenase-like protein (mu-crystallin family)
VSYFPGNVGRDRPDSTGIIVLNDPDDGLPVAIMEGMWITYARTTACAAVAARHLATPGPRRLGLVGCGGLGRWSLLMLSELFPALDEVYVASRTPRSRVEFCREMAEHGPWTLSPVDDLRDAVTGMDIVISSVPASKPHPIAGDWWTPGSVFIPLDVGGSWDDGLFALVDRVVTDGHESFLRVMSRDRPSLPVAEKPWAPIWDIISGRAPGRREGERAMAVVSGVASTDMILGWEIYRRALDMGLGRRVRLT